MLSSRNTTFSVNERRGHIYQSLQHSKDFCPGLFLCISLILWDYCVSVNSQVKKKKNVCIQLALGSVYHQFFDSSHWNLLDQFPTPLMMHHGRDEFWSQLARIWILAVLFTEVFKQSKLQGFHLWHGIITVPTCQNCLVKIKQENAQCPACNKSSEMLVPIFPVTSGEGHILWLFSILPWV